MHRLGARGARLVVGRVAARAARRPSPSPTRRRESGSRASTAFVLITFTVRAPLPVGYLPKQHDPNFKVPLDSNALVLSTFVAGDSADTLPN